MKAQKTGGLRLAGSFTVEASFVVPIILFAIMAIMAMGMNTAKTLSDQIRAEKQEWSQIIEDQIRPVTVLRLGNEASIIFGGTGGD